MQELLSLSISMEQTREIKVVKRKEEKRRDATKDERDNTLLRILERGSQLRETPHCA